MASHYVAGASSSFRKRLLFPFCLFRIIISGPLAVLCAIAYGRSHVEGSASLSQVQDILGIGNGVTEIVLSFIFSCMLLADALSLLLRALRRLSPVFFFRLNAIQAGLSTLVFFFRLITRNTASLCVWVNMFIWYISVSILVYASAVYHEKALRGFVTTLSMMRNRALTPSPPPPYESYGRAPEVVQRGQSGSSASQHHPSESDMHELPKDIV